MFKCEICKKVTKTGDKMHKKTILYRNRNYVYINKYGKEKTSSGKEIVKELNLCDDCFRKVEE